MKALIVYNRSIQGAVSAMTRATAYLRAQGVDVQAVDALELGGLPREEAGMGADDLVVVLGGDGTVLHAASWVGYRRTPILSLNFGHLGFIANDREDDPVPAVSAALSGELAREERSNMVVEVLCDGDAPDAFEGAVADDAEPDGERTFFALNEAALTHGDSGRVVDLRLSVNGTPMTDMRGDGYVVATATGSTAYALSAGGPLLAPDYKGLEAVPLAPHSLRSRALVAGPSDVIDLEVLDSPASRNAELFCDGARCADDAPVLRVRARRGAEPTVLLRRAGSDFYTRVQHTFM